MEKEQELEFRTHFTELKLTGVLNYDIYKEMSKQDLNEFLRRDAQQMARKFVGIEWTGDTNVRSEYIVIDSHYKIHKKVIAALLYNHISGICLKNTTIHDV